MSSNNKNILYAIIAYITGVVLTTNSYNPIAWFFGEFVLTPYVFNRPIEEAVFSVDRALGFVEIDHYMVVAAGTVLLAVSANLAFKFTRQTDKTLERMVGAVVIALAVFEIMATIALPLLY